VTETHPRDWIDILQALFTPAIAFAVGCIAFFQWWTARNRLKLDLFDRRWAVYVAVKQLIADAIAYANVTDEARRKFLVGVQGAKWLFDDRVDRYIYKELHSRVTRLQAANAML